MAIINTNIAALRSARLLASSSADLSKSLGRLASGSKLVSPENDAAGLAMSMRFEAQIHRNNAVLDNLSNAISFTQTQDGFLQKVQKAVDRMGELSTLALDVTKSDEDRANYNLEFQQLFNYLYDDVAIQKFNGVSLFSTTGENVIIDSDGNTFAMTPLDFDGDVALTLIGLTVDTADNADIALNTVKGVIDNLAKERAQVGSNLTRLQATREAVAILNENLSAANSRIKDVDVANESTAFARNNILVQSGTAMLAQANLLPQSALRLLG